MTKPSWSISLLSLITSVFSRSGDSPYSSCKYSSNAFDVVIDLYTPDWGEVRFNGNMGYRALRVSKARGVNVHNQSFPYTITPDQGVVIHKEFSKP